MKRIFLILSLIFCVNADAAVYIVNNQNRVIAKLNYIPNQAELDKRGEVYIVSDTDMELSEVEYRGNRIVKKQKTNAEVKADEDAQVRAEEMDKIDKKMRKTACESLAAEGVVFTQVLCSEFD